MSLDIMQTQNQLNKEASYQGKVTYVDPSQLSYNDTTPTSYPDQHPEVNLGVVNASIESAKLGFAPILRGAYNAVVHGMEMDPNYNAFEDPQFTSRGKEFMADYGTRFKDSLSAKETSDLLDHFDREQTDYQLFNQHPVAAFSAGLVSNVFDIPLFGVPALSRAMIAGESLAARLGQSAVVGGLYGGAFGKASQEVNPAIQNSDVVDYTAAGAIMGAAFTGLFGASKAALDYKKSKDAIKVFAGETGKPGDEMVPEAVKDQNMGAASTRPVLADEQPYAGNAATKGMMKLTSWISPDMEAKQSPSAFMVKWANEFFPDATLSNKNVQGIARDTPAFLAEWDTRAINEIIPLKNKLDELHTEWKAKGNNENFDQYLQLLVNDYKSGTNKMGSNPIKDLFNKYKPIAEELINKNKPEGQQIKLQDDHYHMQLDMNYLINHQNEFSDVLKEQLYKERADFGELSAAEQKSEIDDIINNVIFKDTGIVQTNRFKASALKSSDLLSKLPFDKVAPFLEKDVYENIHDYIKEIELERMFSERYQDYKGQGYFDYFDKKLSQDYAELLNTVKTNTEKNKLVQRQVRDAEIVRNTLDIVTGKFDRPTDSQGVTIRKISNIVRMWQTMRLMGGYLLSNIPDLANTLTSGKFKLLGNEISPLLDNLKTIKLSKDDAAFFSATVDDYLPMTRAHAMHDLTEVKGLSKVEKMMRKGVNGFYTINGANAWNNFNRRLAGGDATRNLLKSMARLVEGKLEDGSMERIELAKLGLDNQAQNLKFAKDVLKEFNTHRIEIKKWGGTHYSPNMLKWTPTTRIRFGAIVNEIINNANIAPTVGDRPFWMSKSIGKMFGQFKGFNMAQIHRTLFPMVQKFALNKEYAAIATTKLMMFLILGNVTGVLKSMALGQGPDLSPERMVVNAFNYSGVFPIISDVSQLLDAKGRGLEALLGTKRRTSKFMDKSIFESLAPSIGGIEDTGRVFSRLTDGNVTASDMVALAKLLPGQNLIGMGYLLNQLKK